MILEINLVACGKPGACNGVNWDTPPPEASLEVRVEILEAQGQEDAAQESRSQVEPWTTVHR